MLPGLPEASVLAFAIAGGEEEPEEPEEPEVPEEPRPGAREEERGGGAGGDTE